MCLHVSLDQEVNDLFGGERLCGFVRPAADKGADRRNGVPVPDDAPVIAPRRFGSPVVLGLVIGADAGDLYCAICKGMHSDFERDATVAIAAPGGAIVTDLMVKDGVLYALGFKKTDDTEIAYTNYIWSLDDSDRFTEIRSFSTRGAYALSFERDEDFFYVGLGGPTTHITEEVSAVGDILRLAITPIE